MRQEGDIGSMDYDQAVKNGDIFFGWSTWMEEDGYAPGESIAFDFENGSKRKHTNEGEVWGGFVSFGTYFWNSEGVYEFRKKGGAPFGVCGGGIRKGGGSWGTGSEYFDF